MKQSDGNEVKAAGHLLNGIPELKHIRIKANFTKAERDEYQRIYELIDKLKEDNPGETVVFEKGMVKLNDTVVDKYKTPTKNF